VSISEMTFTATPRPQGELAFTLLRAGSGAHSFAMWRHVKPPFAGNQSADLRLNPIFTRDRAVTAAKQGSPPRGVRR
jgi:hypothetical protein